ncbi:MAG TPA: DUF885 domain-containing protein [Thermoanaerobaculia bacterium]
MNKIAKIALAATLALTFLGAAPQDPAARLHDLFQREWQHRLKEDPLLATSVGVHDYDDRLPSQTVADQKRRAEAGRAFLAELRSIERTKLSAEDLVNADIFESQLRDRVASFEFGEYEIPLNADSGFHTELARLPDLMTFATVRDYENYLSRIREIPRYVDQHVELMRGGLKRGMTVPRVVLDGIEVTMKSHVVDDPEKSVFWAPFAAFPQTLPTADRERLRGEARKAIRESAVAGYAKLLDFMQKEYIPGARQTLGASEMPNGRAYYDFLVRRFTTLRLTADQVHQTGLAEVERIQKEMAEVIRQTGFKGDFAAFLQFLRTDPRFYAKTPEELLMRASYIAKKMDGKLPSLFKTLPRLPYGVAPVPEHIAPKYTSGRYVEAPFGSTQPGFYWVNTYALDKRPFYNLEALTLHEAVPGHHLQISLSQEREDLPDFRRFSYISTFGEGWGLYSERLGLEAGFYTDPYSNFGRLTYEMWRACRLVVDTGIHAKGWTRDQAIEYLATRTALPLHEVQTETDRYISWPGQALAYKTGELKIRELRARAEKELGEKFDVREFHDAVLRNGSIPLPVLEKAIDRYIAEAKGAEAKARK